jgi:hypothetical protein
LESWAIHCSIEAGHGTQEIDGRVDYLRSYIVADKTDTRSFVNEPATLKVQHNWPLNLGEHAKHDGSAIRDF